MATLLAVRKAGSVCGRSKGQLQKQQQQVLRGTNSPRRLLVFSTLEAPLAGSAATPQVPSDFVPETVTIPTLNSLKNSALRTVPVTITTTCRHEVSAAEASEESTLLIPLTISDVHLRHEQLPFCYFFEETLDDTLLRDSLSRVLSHFPVVAGRIVGHYQAIQCTPPKDSIPIAFGNANISLKQWQSEVRGHSHKAGAGHPVLLPLFDALLDNNPISHQAGNLASIRITYFEEGGTAIGVNFLHALGDTASCVRFVHCWGREMQKLAFPRGASNIRANATCAGMMTEDLAYLMGLGVEKSTKQQLEEPSWWMSTWNKWFPSSAEKNINDVVGGIGELYQSTQVAEEKQRADHEYLHIYFPPNVLRAMKTVGMAEFSMLQSQTPSGTFVSTNDMVTAFGWLLKRSLSRELDYNISIVVNLRGRAGVHAFGDILDEEEKKLAIPDAVEQSPIAQGLFGNGITNVVALYPPTTSSFGIRDITNAALSIRKALQQGLLDIPDRLSQSRLGQAINHVSTASTFATTSWGQFPLWDISFSPNHSVTGFHGHPSHPLPEGKSTYASVIMNTCNGSVLYKLLLPSDQVQEAQQKHQELCQAFLEAEERLQGAQS